MLVCAEFCSSTSVRYPAMKYVWVLIEKDKQHHLDYMTQFMLRWIPCTILLVHKTVIITDKINMYSAVSEINQFTEQLPDILKIPSTQLNLESTAIGQGIPCLLSCDFQIYK